MSKRTLVTAALPYANGPLHLGHLAGAYLPADLYVRFLRLQNEDVLFICGSDEHGVPITIAAEKQGVTPQEIVDKFHFMNVDVFKGIGISFDHYGRTTSKTHHKTAADFFTVLNDKKVLIRKTEKQLYDEKAHTFLADRYIVGTCPRCGYENAYGDQCERCGSTLSPSDLINSKSMLTGTVPVYKETEHWYLPLGTLQKQLESWLNEKSDWKSNVLGQCKSWLNAGLTDRAVTRDLNWGIKVPLTDAKGKVLYVWFEAPIGYISSTKDWAIDQGNPDLWKTYWMDKDTDLIHFIGKDNIVFHCIMFPAMLMAHGDFILPKNVPANEFLNLEGQKLSTSRGWAVWIHEYLKEFPSDMLRYVIGTTLPENKDSDFTWKDFQTRVNSELADILGNFIFRTFSFTHRFFEGVVPELTNPSNSDLETLELINTKKESISSLYKAFNFREAIAETMNLARVGNKFFTDSEPWKTRNTNIQACGNTLHVCIQISAALSVLFEPVIPFSMSVLRKDMNLSDTISWDEIGSNMIQSGSTIKQGAILFNKIEDTSILSQIKKLEVSTQPMEIEYPKMKPRIEFSDFDKLDLRSAEIIHARRVTKSKKLLELVVDIGIEKRTIVSGIGEFFTPDDIIGYKVVVITNLNPRNIMGIESNGMILMATTSDNSLKFLHTDAPPGSIIS